MARPSVFRRFLELVLDRESAKKVERDTQEALKNATDPKTPVSNLKKIEGDGFQSLVAAAKKAAGLVAAYFGAKELFGKFIHETSEGQKTTAQLEAVIRSTGMAAGKTAEQLEDMAKALQETTAFSDEQVKAAEALLLTQTEIRGLEFDRAIKLTLDLATAMGTDATTAALQLGKALEDPTTGLTALRRAGIIFSASQIEVIKNLVETGKQAQAQNLIFDALEVKIGGSAEAYRNTLGGALDHLSNSWGDLFEVTQDSTTGMIGAINALADSLPAVRSKFDTFFRFIQMGWIGLRSLGASKEGVEEGRRALQALWDEIHMEELGGFVGPPQSGMGGPPPRGGAGDGTGDPASLFGTIEPQGRVPLRPNVPLSGTPRSMQANPITAMSPGSFIPQKDELKGFTEFYLSNMDEITSASQVAALGIQGAFQQAFSAMGEEGNAAANFLEAAFRGSTAAVIGVIAQMAAVKVTENIAKATEDFADATTAASNPFTAVLAPGYIAAGRGHLLAAAKWALFGGVAGAAASGVSGGGTNSFRGSDSVGRQVDKIDRGGPDIIIHIDGVDPSNPRHQALVGRTAQEYKRRYGGTVSVQ